MSPRIQCRGCRGRGTILLPHGPLLDAWRLLAMRREPINASGLARIAEIGATAMCERLVGLERLGLAVGPRRGRERLWTAITHDAEPEGAPI